jgi:hypothetical protein
MINIPFFYKYSPRFIGYLTLSDINDGMTACRRLGLDPIEITVGKNEYYQMEHWTFIGKSEKEKLRDVLKMKINKSNKRNEIVFLCKPWRNFNL